jgi:hypothetical protein
MSHLDEVAAASVNCSDEQLTEVARTIREGAETAREEDGWEHVSFTAFGVNQTEITTRLGVPGGYLYRTIVDVMHEDGERILRTAVAMVFVPEAVAVK